MRQQFESGVAGVLEHYPERGRMTSATVGIFYGAATIQAVASITLDTASQTITTATAGETSITVAATTAFVVGRRYWVQTSTTGSRGVEVRLVDKTSTVLTVADPLPFTATGGSITGHGLRYTLTTAHTATRYRRVRVEWRMTDLQSNVLPVVTEYIDIVRRPWTMTLTHEDILEVSALYGETVGSSRLLEQQADAARRRIWADLEAQGLWPDLLRDTSLLRDAMIYIILSHREARRVETGSYDRWTALYRERIAQVIASPKLWYDEDDDLDEDTDPTTGEQSEAYAPPLYTRVG